MGKNDKKYYDGSQLLSMKDIDGEEAGIYMVVSNRTAGKTTFFLKKFLDDFLKSGKEFVLIYRKVTEIFDCTNIFKDVLYLYFNGKEITSKTVGRMFTIIYLDGVACGYAVHLKAVDSLKKYSPTFKNVSHALFDEFLTEDNSYIPNEIEKLESVLMTISRGGGEQSRYIKLIMLANKTVLINPYFVYFDITKRLKQDTKFMRGSGWVLELTFNKSAANAIEKNPTFKAFKGSNYSRYATSDEFLHDSKAFLLQKGEIKSKQYKYIFTLVHGNAHLGVKLYIKDGILLITEKYEPTFKLQMTFKSDNHTQNTIMLQNNSYLWRNVKEAYNQGYIRFDSPRAKQIIFELLSVDTFK